MSLLSTFFFLTLLLTTPPYSPGHKHHTWGFSEPPFKRPARLFSPVQENICLFWAPTDRRSPSWGFQVLREETAVGTSGGWGSHKDSNKENCKKGLKILYRCREPLYKLGGRGGERSKLFSLHLRHPLPLPDTRFPGARPRARARGKIPSRWWRPGSQHHCGAASLDSAPLPFFNLPGLGLLLLLLKLLGHLRL